MEKVLEKIFDFVVQDEIGFDKNTGQIYEKIHKNLNPDVDEDEIFGNIAELVYLEQLSAFKSGIRLTFNILNEIST